MKYFRFLIYLLVAAKVSLVSAGAYEDFFRAVREDDAGAVGGLLARGLDPNSVDETGQPALTVAARDGSLRVAEVLLAHPALKPDQVNRSNETALMIAALKGRAPLVTRLLDRGAAIDRPGWSPLHYAATGPEPGLVKLLVDRGAALDARSPNGTTPLMMAAQYGEEASVDLLLSRGASAQARNERGLDVADFARLAGREKLAARLAALRR
jgi:ankyrin repeat protein